MVLVGDTIEGHCRTRRNTEIHHHPGPGHHTKQSSWVDLRSNDNVCLLGHLHAWVICSKASEMRVSTSKLAYVVFHMSLLQVAWGLTLVAQVCQKTFGYIIRVHIHVLLHAFATKLPGGHPIRGPKFGARSPGPDSCGIGMPKSIWLHHHRSHTCASKCLCYKVAWGHFVRGPKFGARLLWHRHAKLHLITSSEFTYMCFYMPLLQSCLGALWSGPEVRGPTLVAQVCQKKLITSSEFTYMCFYDLLRTCLCYKVAWGHPVRGLKFGAWLLWHRYGIRTRWIETHVCPLLLLWDEARNPII